MESTNCNRRELAAANARELGSSRAERIFLPRTDVAETREAVVLYLDMPGVDKSGLQVDLDNRVLTVSGAVSPAIPQSMQALRREFEFGSYKRSFTLSDAIDVEGINATIRNGVVEITLPKAEEVKPRKIAVKAV